MKVVRIKGENRFPITSSACRHFQFDIFVPDVFLLIVHAGRER